MEQLEFDFMKEEKDKFIIYNEEEKIYPFNIFFNSEEEAWNYLNIRAEGRYIPKYFFKIHKFGIKL
jgi:hypothetical protein